MAFVLLSFKVYLLQIVKMNPSYIADKTYKNQDYTVTDLQKAEYDNCTFINCNFNACYLSSITFLDCQFIDCDLSNSKTSDTTYKDVIFKNCKLLGVLFNDCNQLLMSITFDKCQLNFASFYQVKLISTTFTNCQFDKTEFTEANLTKCIFDNCDFSHAVFLNTNLEQANFLTSYNYTIHPGNNKIKGAKFSKDQIHGLLDAYKIHIS